MKRTDISFLPINFSNKGPRDHVMIRRELWLVQFLNCFTDRNQLLHQIDILTTQIWLKQSTVANKLSLIDIMMGYVWGKKGKHYFLKLSWAHISKRQSGFCKVEMWRCFVFINFFLICEWYYLTCHKKHDKRMLHVTLSQCVFFHQIAAHHKLQTCTSRCVAITWRIPRFDILFNMGYLC